jgi:hypothetical protein
MSAIVATASRELKAIRPNRTGSGKLVLIRGSISVSGYETISFDPGSYTIAAFTRLLSWKDNLLHDRHGGAPDDDRYH